LPEKEIQMPCSEICLIAPSDALGRKGTKILIEEKLNAAAVGIPGMLSDYMDAMKKARQIPANGINQFIIRVNWFFYVLKGRKMPRDL